MLVVSYKYLFTSVHGVYERERLSL